MCGLLAFSTCKERQLMLLLLVDSQALHSAMARSTPPHQPHLPKRGPAQPLHWCMAAQGGDAALMVCLRTIHTYMCVIFVQRVKIVKVCKSFMYSTAVLNYIYMDTYACINPMYASHVRMSPYSAYCVYSPIYTVCMLTMCCVKSLAVC